MPLLFDTIPVPDSRALALSRVLITVHAVRVTLADLSRHDFVGQEGPILNTQSVYSMQEYYFFNQLGLMS